MNNTAITIPHPGFPPPMATISQMNEWLLRYNAFHAADVDRGYAFNLKGGRYGSRTAAIVWWIVEAETGRLSKGFEDRDEALKALDAIERKS